MTRPAIGTVTSLGVYLVDVLGYPVPSVPDEPSVVPLDRIRITAAGTAGGPAVDLAKLGADVRAVGAVGTDRLATVLTGLLEEYGVDTSGLVRKEELQTAATIAPVRADGRRPSLHVSGAIPLLTRDDVDVDALLACDAVHVGGPEMLGDFAVQVLPELLRRAHDRGRLVTMDLLRATPAALDTIRPLLPFVHHLLPNQHQLRVLTGEDDIVTAARRLLSDGVEQVVVTLGDHGSLLIGPHRIDRVPGVPVPVVDTTGCGDAYTAAFIVGRLLGRDAVDAARLATAAGALVVQGLGSDAGIVDLAHTLEFLTEHPLAVNTELSTLTSERG